MPIVLRIAEANLAASIARHFEFETTFSVAALAGPVFAGLSHMPGARGRIAFDGREFAIAESVLVGEDELPPGTIALAAGNGGSIAPIRDFAGLAAGTRVLSLSRIA
jgi:hypothetical protein